MTILIEDQTKRKKKFTTSKWPAQMSTDGAHPDFWAANRNSPDCVETFSNTPLDSLSVRSWLTEYPTMLCKFPRPLPKQFVSTISAASFVRSTRLHASLILSNVKPSRRDEGSTCYGMNNVSNAGIETGFDLIIAEGLTLSAKFTNDDFDRRPEKKNHKVDVSCANRHRLCASSLGRKLNSPDCVRHSERSHWIPCQSVRVWRNTRWCCVAPSQAIC